MHGYTNSTMTSVLSPSNHDGELFPLFPYVTDTTAFSSSITSGVLALLGLIENLVVILSIVFVEGYLDAPSNIFLVSLAVAELCLCVAVPLFIFTFVIEWIFEYFIIVGKFVGFVTVSSMFLLTLNRMVSVVWSLQYLTIMTTKRAWCMVLAVWTAAFLLLGFVGISYLTGLVLLGQLLRYFLTLFLFLSLGMNVYLYKKSRRHRMRIRAEIPCATPEFISKTSKDFRSIKTLIMVSGTFLLGWLPMTIVTLTTDRFTRPREFHHAFSIAVPFTVANTVLDPIIYFFRSDLFKKLKNSLKRRFCSITCSCIVVCYCQ